MQVSKTHPKALLVLSKEIFKRNFYTLICIIFGVCFRFIADSSQPGLRVTVNDGTKCGENRVCLDHKCIDIASVLTSQCPRDETGNVCSGKGVS